jgi:hypothetical protein
MDPYATCPCRKPYKSLKKTEKRSRNLDTEITDTLTNKFAEPKLDPI